MSKYEDYYPLNPEIRESIEILGKDNLDESSIINNLVKAINLLQNHI
jgi:hypothetical protein